MTGKFRPRGGAFYTLGLGLVCALLGGLGGWYWQSRQIGVGAGGHFAERDRVAIEQLVHDYLVEHPEVLPEAMDALTRKQDAMRLAGLRDVLEQATAGTVLGNPQGKITLVEFADYACGYCRHSVEDVEALIAANPDLRVVVRELPILSPESADAAKMAIAAAQQGRYAAFHKAMYAASRPDAQSIAAAARAAGLDMAQARKTIAAPATEQELVRNMDIAKRLGFSGTPSWVVGDNLMTGAVGREQLAKAIADARS